MSKTQPTYKRSISELQHTVAEGGQIIWGQPSYRVSEDLNRIHVILRGPRKDFIKNKLKF
jgi:hypothetical protein